MIACPDVRTRARLLDLTDEFLVETSGHYLKRAYHPEAVVPIITAKTQQALPAKRRMRAIRGKNDERRPVARKWIVSDHFARR